MRKTLAIWKTKHCCVLFFTQTTPHEISHTLVMISHTFQTADAKCPGEPPSTHMEMSCCTLPADNQMGKGFRVFFLLLIKQHLIDGAYPMTMDRPLLSPTLAFTVSKYPSVALMSPQSTLQMHIYDKNICCSMLPKGRGSLFRHHGANTITPIITAVKPMICRFHLRFRENLMGVNII